MIQISFGTSTSSAYADAEPGLEEGTPGWRLVPADGETRIFKTYRHAFIEEALGEMMETLDVTRLVIAGPQSDYCVRGRRASRGRADLTNRGPARRTGAWCGTIGDMRQMTIIIR